MVSGPLRTGGRHLPRLRAGGVPAQQAGRSRHIEQRRTGGAGGHVLRRGPADDISTNSCRNRTARCFGGRGLPSAGFESGRRPAAACPEYYHELRCRFISASAQHQQPCWSTFTEVAAETLSPSPPIRSTGATIGATSCRARAGMTPRCTDRPWWWPFGRRAVLIVCRRGFLPSACSRLFRRFPEERITPAAAFLRRRPLANWSFRCSALCARANVVGRRRFRLEAVFRRLSRSIGGDLELSPGVVRRWQRSFRGGDYCANAPATRR